MVTSSGYQLWLVTVDADGERYPYQLIGCVETFELANALMKAAIDTGYEAMIKEL